MVNLVLVLVFNVVMTWLDRTGSPRPSHTHLGMATISELFVGLEVRQHLSDVGLEVGVCKGGVGIFVGLVEWGHED